MQILEKSLVIVHIVTSHRDKRVVPSLPDLTVVLSG